MLHTRKSSRRLSLALPAQVRDLLKATAALKRQKAGEMIEGFLLTYAAGDSPPQAPQALLTRMRSERRVSFTVRLPYSLLKEVRSRASDEQVRINRLVALWILAAANHLPSLTRNALHKNRMHSQTPRVEAQR